MSNNISSQNIFNNIDQENISIPNYVTFSDIPKLSINISKLIELKIDKANKNIKKYYPPISDFTNTPSATKVIRPKLEPPLNLVELPTNKFPYNPIYNLLNGDTVTGTPGFKKTLYDYLASLIQTIKEYNGDSSRVIPAPTCIPYSKAVEILKSGDDTTYCSSYSSSNTSLQNIVPKLYKGVGNITNTGCLQSEQVKLSCLVPNYFQLRKSLGVIDSIVANIMQQLEKIDQLIKFNTEYEKEIDKQMKFHLDVQTWLNNFNSIFSKKSTSNTLAQQEQNSIENITNGGKAINNLCNSFYRCYYDNVSNFGNECMEGQKTSCLGLIVVAYSHFIYLELTSSCYINIAMAENKINTLTTDLAKWTGKLTKDNGIMRAKDGCKPCDDINSCWGDTNVPSDQECMDNTKTKVAGDAVGGGCQIVSDCGSTRRGVCHGNAMIIDYRRTFCIIRNYDKIARIKNDININTESKKSERKLLEVIKLIVPPTLVLACCSQTVNCPDGTCSAIQTCKVKITTSSTINGESSPQPSPPAEIPGQTGLEPLCWNTKNAKITNQCMAGWVKFTDGNCYMAPAESTNECSPYNQQELANMSNDELTTFYNLCKINNPINCPAPKYTPPPINLINSNVLVESEKKFKKDINKYREELILSLDDLYDDGTEANISKSPVSIEKVIKDKEKIEIIQKGFKAIPPSIPKPLPSSTQSLLPPPVQSTTSSTTSSTTPSSTPSSSNNYIMYTVIIIIGILFICSICFYFNKKKKFKINN
jgi:hypothetical protein